MDEKELIIFLSGTRRDIPHFWPVAKQALSEAFPDFEIRLMEDAEPEDIPGDHWSRREATKPDALVGLIGRYYGRVPRDRDHSLTEQEFDIAGRVGIDRLMFTTNVGTPEVVASQSPGDVARINAFRENIDECVVRRGISTPAEFAEHAVKAVQQWERRKLRGALQEATVFFAPLLDPNLLFSHTERLVGQSQVLEALRSFCDSDKRVFVLHAPWGRGKSRLLLEFSRVAEKPVRFLRADIPLTRQRLNISAADPMVLVIDDLQRRDDSGLQHLLGFLQRCTAEVKLVVSSRTNRVDAFTGLLRSQGLPMCAVETAEAPALSDGQQHELIAQILGGKNEFTYQIALRTRGSTLAALLAARMIRRQQTTFVELNRSPDFVSEVLGRFQDALLLSPDLDATIRERLKALLQLIAVCSPIRPGDPEERDALARFLARQPEELSRDIELLEDRGLLLRRGGLATIPVDAIRETEALRACVTTRGDLTGLADRALRELAGTFRANLLRNLALVETHAEHGGHSFNVLERVWPEIEAAYGAMPGRERLRLLEDLEDVAPLQPQETLRFVQYALLSGLGPPETQELWMLSGPPPLRRIYDGLTRLVRGTLYNAECVPNACDLLWDMARDDARSASQYTDCAERALQDLANLDAYRPIACYEGLLAWVEVRIADGRIPGERLVAYLQPMLDKELERGYSDESAMHLWASPLPLEKALPLHRRVLAALDRLAKRSDLRCASLAIMAIGHALHDPEGAFQRKVTTDELRGWEPEQLDGVEHLRSIADHHRWAAIDLRVLCAATPAAKFAKRSALRSAADALHGQILARRANTPELAMMPAWGPPWGPGRGAERRHATEVAKIADYLVRREPNARLLTDRIVKAHAELRAAELNPDARPLLHELTSKNTAFGIHFAECVNLCPEDPIGEDAGGVLLALLQHDRHRGLELLDASVEHGGDYLHQAVARGYLTPAWRESAGEERCVRHWRHLLAQGNIVTRAETLRAIWLAKELPATARLELLLSYDPSQDGKSMDTWSIALDDLYSDLTAEQRRRLLDRLEQVLVLDYFAEEILLKLTVDEPDCVIDMLVARVRRAGERREHYEAVPDRHQRDCLQNVPAYARERGLVALGDALISDDFRVQAAAQRLFAALGGHDPLAQRRVRMVWAAGDARQIVCAAQSFRGEPPIALFEEEETIVAILRAAERCGAEVLRLARSELMCVSSNEVRTGTPGEPAPLDVAIRDRAIETAAKYPAGSTEAALYKSVAELTQSIIDRLLTRDAEETLHP